VLERWTEYGQGLFAKPDREEELVATGYDETEPPQLLSEIEQAISKLKQGKAPGLDGIPAELIQNSGSTGQ
jgi:hypothetical protein